MVGGLSLSRAEPTADAKIDDMPSYDTSFFLSEFSANPRAFWLKHSRVRLRFGLWVLLTLLSITLTWISLATCQWLDGNVHLIVTLLCASNAWYTVCLMCSRIRWCCDSHRLEWTLVDLIRVCLLKQHTIARGPKLASNININANPNLKSNLNSNLNLLDYFLLPEYVSSCIDVIVVWGTLPCLVMLSVFLNRAPYTDPLAIAALCCCVLCCLADGAVTMRYDPAFRLQNMPRLNTASCWCSTAKSQDILLQGEVVLFHAARDLERLALSSESFLPTRAQIRNMLNDAAQDGVAHGHESHGRSFGVFVTAIASVALVLSMPATPLSRARIGRRCTRKPPRRQRNGRFPRIGRRDL